MPALPLVITSGEPAGIGPDLVIGLAARGQLGDSVVIGDPDVLTERARQLGLPLHLSESTLTTDRSGKTPGLRLHPVHFPRPVTAGRLDAGNAATVLEMLDIAVDGCLDGRFAGLVTAPVHKGIINEAGVAFTGHTEYIAKRCGDVRPVMMLTADRLRVALATTHCPLKEVSARITGELLIEVLTILNDELRRRFGIEAPRILVCGLNPHAGENGHLGTEEIDTIIPALETLRARGLHLTGPLPADTLFTPATLEQADAVLAMYHDQGLPVLKHIGFGHAINVTLGLGIIRTSVDHGTALDLAGSGEAHDGSLRAAIKLATEMTT